MRQRYQITALNKIIFVQIDFDLGAFMVNCLGDLSLNDAVKLLKLVFKGDVRDLV